MWGMRNSRSRVAWAALGMGVVAAVAPPLGGGAAVAQMPAPALGSVAERQKDPVQLRLEAVLQRMRSEEYEQAAVDLAMFLTEERKRIGEARYYLGKALYRMGLLHSALAQFERLLAKGSKGYFYAPSLEWCLFIGRKMVADAAVNEVVARFTHGGFPEEYRDEFLFRLARFHYARAVAIDASKEASRLGETEVKETKAGTISIRGDLFGEDNPGGAEEVAPSSPEKVNVRRKRGGGLSIDQDLFGDPAESKRRRSPAARKKKRPRRPRPGEKRVLTSKEHAAAAERFAARVRPDSEYGARSRYLEALLLYKQGKENEALEAFKTVVRMTRGRDSRADTQLRESAFFQLARAHYGAQQPTFSTFYYRKVDRDSLQWLDALYEASWANFRLGDFEKALGNLLTVHAPLFEDIYLPESHILKAVIYYENCRYAEAKDILTDFLAKHEPVLAELERMTARAQSPERYYATLAGLRTADSARTDRRKAQTFARVVEIALSDPELGRLDASYQEVKRERTKVEETTGPLAGSRLQDRLLMHLDRVLASLARDAGRAVKNQLEREKVQIRDLVQQAIRINIETSRSEQERIESQLRNIQSRPKSVSREFVGWTDDEKVVWPFDGEYWRDELGTYEITLAHSCR